ncbi:MAG: glycosyltransferase family 39 protein [Parcubacteria group bacterium]
MKIKYPGLYASEITHAPAALGLPHAPALVKVGNVPILVMAYYGAVKVYVGWLFFKLLGVSVLAIRLPWILCTAAGLIALYYGLRKYTNRTIALFTVVLLVVDPTFVSQTKLDSGPVALEFLIKASVISLWATILKRNKLLLLLPLWLLLALGEYNKLNFLWFVNSFYISIVIVYWREIRSWWHQAQPKIRIGLLSFFAGYPLLVGYFVLIQQRFNILSYSDKPFDLRERLEVIANQFEQHIQGSIFFNFALGKLDEPWLPWFFWAVVLICTLGLVVLFANAILRCSLKRQAIFLLLIVLSTITQIIATKNAKAPWHLFALFPYLTVLIAMAVYALGAIFKRRVLKVAIWIGCMLVFAIPGVVLHARYLDAYDDPTTNIRWSSAIYEVLAYTKEIKAKFVCVDWGTYTPLAVLDPVPGKYLNNVWYFRREKSERYAETAKRYFDPARNFLFILQDGERAYFKDAQENFFKSVEASGYRLDPVLNAGNGPTPDFTIYRTR